MGKSEPEGTVMREVKRTQNAFPLGSYATAVSGHPRSHAPSEPPSRTYLDTQEIITQPEPAHHRGALPHSPSSSSRPAKGYSEHEKPGRSAQVVDGAESLAARRSHTRRERRVEPTRAKDDGEEGEDEIEDDSDDGRYGSEGGMDVDQPAKVVNARVARSTQPPPRSRDAAESLPSSTSSTASSSRSPTPIAHDAACPALHTRAYPPRPTPPTSAAPPRTDAMIEVPEPLNSDAIAKDKARRKEVKHRNRILQAWDADRETHGDLVVAREFNKRQHDIEVLDRTKVELLNQYCHAERRQVDLAGDLAKRAKVVADLEHQLSSSRAFVESSDLSSTALSQSLIALSSQVKSVAHGITASLISPSLPREMTLSGEHLVAISQALADSGPRGARLLELAIEVAERESFVVHWIYGAIAETIATGIWKGVLGKFHPALSAKEDAILRRLYRIVRTTESQDRSARWRSITYSRAAPSAPSPTHALTNTLLSHIFLILSVVSSSSTLDVSIHGAQIAALIDAALVWHRTAMIDVLSRDFVGIIDDGSEIRTAEVVGGFGLKVRSGDGGKEGKRMEKVVVRVPMMRL